MVGVITRTRCTYNRLHDPVAFVLNTFGSHWEGKTNHLLIYCEYVDNDAPKQDAPCSFGCNHTAGQVG